VIVVERKKGVMSVTEPDITEIYKALDNYKLLLEDLNKNGKPTLLKPAELRDEYRALMPLVETVLVAFHNSRKLIQD